MTAAFGANHINFTKGYPSMYAVDLAIPVEDTDITEGMCIHENDAGAWEKGCPRGKMPYVTGHEQFPTALDVGRGDGEMGRENLGGVCLINAVEFETTAFTGNPAGKYVYGGADGLFAAIGDLASQQIAAYCRSTYNDIDSDSVALLIGCPVPNPEADGYPSQSISSQSESSLST